MGTEFPFRMMKKLWGWMVVMVAYQWQCTLCHCFVALKIAKMINFMLCVYFTTQKRC